MGGHRAVLGAPGPGDGGGPLAGLVGGDVDPVVLGGAGVFGLQAADALPDLGDALVGAGAGEPVVELREGVLEAGGGALDDAALLRGPLLGVAVEADLVGVVGDDLVPLHGLVGAGPQGTRRRWPRTGGGVRG